MAQKGIQKQIDDFCAHLGCGVDRLFVQAFHFAFGRRRGILREARSAHTKFKDKKTLTQRARKALLAFFKGFNAPLVPSTS